MHKMPKDIWVMDCPNGAAAVRKTPHKGLELVCTSKGRNARKQVESFVALRSEGVTNETLDMTDSSRLDAKSINLALRHYINNMDTKPEQKLL